MQILGTNTIRIQTKKRLALSCVQIHVPKFYERVNIVKPPRLSRVETRKSKKSNAIISVSAPIWVHANDAMYAVVMYQLMG